MSLSLPSDTTHIPPGAVAQGGAAPRKALSFIKDWFRLRARRLRRKILVNLRRPFRIDEDDIRDHVLDSLLRDNQDLAKALNDAVSGLNHVHGRLKYYEKHIPRMRDLRSQYDDEQRAKHNGLTESQKADLGNGILQLEGPRIIS
jgi:hypothetical protein